FQEQDHAVWQREQFSFGTCSGSVLDRHGNSAQIRKSQMGAMDGLRDRDGFQFFARARPRTLPLGYFCGRHAWIRDYAICDPAREAITNNKWKGVQIALHMRPSSADGPYVCGTGILFRRK